jgi:uncharacterized damage-inducible protein DinB
MSLSQTILAEFETQAPITRKFLERLPDDRLTWKPHERSMTAGQLALHIAAVPGGIIRLVQQTTNQAPDFEAMMPQPSSIREILETHENSAIAVRSILPQLSDAALQEHCRLLQGDQELLAMPRAWFLRDIMLNHVYQHRGQFSVYLRVLNVPVPASWGPSADELPEFLQRAQTAQTA